MSFGEQGVPSWGDMNGARIAAPRNLDGVLPGSAADRHGRHNGLMLNKSLSRLWPRPPEAALERRASRSATDRCPRGLRHLRLRGLHGRPGRRERQELLGARRAGGRLRGDHRAGPRPGRGVDRPAAGGPRTARAAVRLLHTGDADDGPRPAPGEPGPHRGRGAAGPGGNLCRCTGYQNTVRAVLAAACGSRDDLERYERASAAYFGPGGGPDPRPGRGRPCGRRGPAPCPPPGPATGRRPCPPSPPPPRPCATGTWPG
ncbi:hypothetical protein SUDANB15_06864 [Streptomyces sp. enrichment culture]